MEDSTFLELEGGAPEASADPNVCGELLGHVVVVDVVVVMRILSFVSSKVTLIVRMKH